jgi:ATP-dependent Lhr-like helicase
LRLALETRLTERLGYRPQCVHHDDGILLRLADADEPVLDLFDGLTAENVESHILQQLTDSALFAMRFRQNAVRALLLPRMQPGKRAPLWLQRLRGRDLLQVARGQRDFPVVAETIRECLHDHLDVDSLRRLLDDIRDGQVEVAMRRVESPSPFAASLLFAFTAAFMYQYDGAEKSRGRIPDLDQRLLEQLIAPSHHVHLLDARAVHQVERRLRGVGQPPRSATEMTEWLRRLGDMSLSELEGPMAGFLKELENDGRAIQIEIPGAKESRRWILAEEAALYQQAFGQGMEPAGARRAAEQILERFLKTHALVGLQDACERYGFDRNWTQGRLEEWAANGDLVAVPSSEPEAIQYLAPANLERVQRTSLSLLRREVASCPPQQFADFLFRWQGLHPSNRQGTYERLTATMNQLEGLALPVAVWEKFVFPSRVAGYLSRWLDEALAGGEWVWVCGEEKGADRGVLTFWKRENVGELAGPGPADGEVPFDQDMERTIDALRESGASFIVDLTRLTHLTPDRLRIACWKLCRRGLISNDYFGLLRNDRTPRDEASNRVFRQSRLRAGLRQEGRWFPLSWGNPDTEALAVFHARLLLRRYGIVARELALLDSGLLPWRVLYEVLSRMELAGEVRRGYFVEGVSGAQFALPEAARELQEVKLATTACEPLLLVNSLDPASLYGSGAPFDIPLLDGGTRPLLRRSGQWLVFRAGRPILIVEQQGKNLTALASASQDEIAQAVGLLPSMLSGNGSGIRQKVTVEHWNGEPVTTSEGMAFLQAAGFVRDYQGMTLYAAWR